MCTPLPACAGSSSGVKRRARPVAAGDLAHDLAQQRPRGRRRRAPSAARDGDLELVRGVLGHEPLRLDARLAQRAHHAARERLGAPLRLQRERQRRRLRRSSSWNSCSKLASSAQPELRLAAAASASRRKLRGQHSHGRPSVSTMSQSTSSSALAVAGAARRARACRGRAAGAGRRSSRTGWARRACRSA